MFRAEKERGQVFISNTALRPPLREKEGSNGRTMGSAGEEVTELGWEEEMEKALHPHVPWGSTSLEKGDAEEPDMGEAGLAWGCWAEATPLSSARLAQWGQGPGCLS